MSKFLLSSSLDGWSLRLSFQHQRDRFGHFVELVGNEAEKQILKSVEDPPIRYWPSSPPLQQLSIEPIQGKDAALLTGMSGRSHWSASVTSLDQQPGFEFDIAVRLQLPASEEEEVRLGSRYAIPSDFGAMIREEEAITSLSIMIPVIADEAREARFSPILKVFPGTAETRLEFGGGNRQAFELIPEFDVDQTVASVRWKYQMLLAKTV